MQFRTLLRRAMFLAPPEGPKLPTAYCLLRVSVQPLLEASKGPRSHHRLSSHPTATRLKNTILDLIELRHAVRIGVYCQQRSALLRHPSHRVGQIQAVWRTVYFQRHARLRGRSHHSLQIELHRPTAPQQSRGRMTDDVNVRTRDRVQQSASHFVFALLEGGVHRSGHNIKTRKDRVRVI